MMRTRTILGLALLASTAACGGGGGGGAAPASAGAAPNQPGSTAPSANIANPMVMMTSDGKISFTDGTSQTLTNEDNVLTINVPGLNHSFDFTGPLDTSTFTPDNSSFAAVTDHDADGNKITAVKFNDGSQLDAMTFGIWQKFAGDSANMTASGAFTQGNDTPAAQMPTTGTATYAGQSIGTGQDSTGTFTLTGTSNVNADFGNRLVSGNVQLSKFGQDGGPWATLQFNNAAIAANSNKFAGTIAGSGMSGGVQGAFYGDATNQRGPAGEVGGTFGAAGGGQSVTGAFGAAKQ